MHAKFSDVIMRREQRNPSWQPLHLTFFFSLFWAPTSISDLPKLPYNSFPCVQMWQMGTPPLISVPLWHGHVIVQVILGLFPSDWMFKEKWLFPKSSGINHSVVHLPAILLHCLWAFNWCKKQFRRFSTVYIECLPLVVSLPLLLSCRLYTCSRGLWYSYSLIWRLISFTTGASPYSSPLPHTHTPKGGQCQNICHFIFMAVNS